MSGTFDAEANVVGGALLVADAYWQVSDLLTAEDFADAELAEIWTTIGELCRSGVTPDAVTIGDRNPKIATTAMRCAAETAGVSNIRAYAEKVQRDALARRVRATGPRIAKLGGLDVYGEAQQILAACAPRMASAIRPVSEFLKQSVAQMAERCDATEILTGVPTSLDWLDEKLSGWQRGDLILIGARPSVGKTALALQATAYATGAGHPVLFLSLEMSGAQLTDRLLAHASGVDMQLIRQPKMIAEDQWPRIAAAGEIIAKMPLLIDETCALTLEGICARVRQANAKQRLAMVVIDYLTLVKMPRADRHDLAVGAVTGGLKRLAKELRIPIVLLSQLNREGTQRPVLKDLRDSGSLEQDADVVVFLHRPDDGKRDLLECIIAKQRNGPTGATFLHFNGATQRFTPTNERPKDTSRPTRLAA